MKKLEGKNVFCSIDELEKRYFPPIEADFTEQVKNPFRYNINLSKNFYKNFKQLLKKDRMKI